MLAQVQGQLQSRARLPSSSPSPGLFQRLLLQGRLQPNQWGVCAQLEVPRPSGTVPKRHSLPESERRTYLRLNLQ